MSTTPAWGEPTQPHPQQPPGQPPPYQPPAYEPPAAPAGLTCPKCRGEMRTYERNGIHLEQCGSCRGIFLDFGELEALTRLETQLAQPAPAPAPQPAPQPTTVVHTPQPQQHYGPTWGSHGHQRYRKRGLGGLFFSS